ncbi:MAG TPA: hypothetical protein VFV65_00280 [Gemmatimonadales bacterium]|nr:hypothetical protein [Gemmatimonadales bacterium]
MQVTRWLSLAATLALPARVTAQAPAYTAGVLERARFSETVGGTLQSTFAAARRTETVGRDGILSVRAAPDSGGLVIEAWYDSLAVVREGPEGRFTPDAAGIVGGRYRGTLTPDGVYTSSVVPFVPAALRDIFDLSRLLLHFFPRLPPGPLAPGADWTDAAGLTIWRLADSSAPGGPVRRYRWIRRAAWDEGVGSADSTVVVHRTEREDGTLRWSAAAGPVGWTRRIVAGVELADGGGRSELTQEVRVRRLPAAP